MSVDGQITDTTYFIGLKFLYDELSTHSGAVSFPMQTLDFKVKLVPPDTLVSRVAKNIKIKGCPDLLCVTPGII